MAFQGFFAIIIIHELAALLSVQQAITSHIERQDVLLMIADAARQLTRCGRTAVRVAFETG